MKPADSARMRVEEELKMHSNKILKNIEEYWDITSSIKDLERLLPFNQAKLREKSDRLKHLRSSLLQWPHEAEISSLQLEIHQIQSTMDINKDILDNLHLTLKGNLKS